MSVQKRRGGKYRARWRDPTGRERSKHFARKIDAINWEASQRAACQRGEWVDPAAADITVGEFGNTWLASKAGLKPSTLTNYEILFRLHITPRWGSTRLRAVTVGDVTVWVAQMVSSDMSPSWVRQAHLCLKQILDLAVKDGRLARNVASSVKSPRSNRREPRFLAHEELADLAQASDIRGQQHGTLVLLLGYTGLRWGEARALRGRHVDLLHRRVIVADNLPSGRGNDRVDPKSHQRRNVPLPQFLVARLEALVGRKSPDEYLFCSESGRPLDNSNWRRAVFDPAVRETALAPLTPHDLRHTAASLAVSAGAHVKSVQKMLGHASAAMTLDIYAGLFDGDLDDVAERLDVAATAANSGRQTLVALSSTISNAD